MSQCQSYVFLWGRGLGMGSFHLIVYMIFVTCLMLHECCIVQQDEQQDRVYKEPNFILSDVL